MNNKGFTLIEVLTVTIILGVIAIITIPIIDKVIKDSNQRTYQLQVDTIKNAAKSWSTNNPEHLPAETGDTTTVELRTLKQTGYIDMKIINPLTNEFFYDNTYVIITKRYNNYTYEVIVSDTPDANDQVYSESYELVPTISLNNVLPTTTISRGSSYTVSANDITATAKGDKTITDIEIDIRKNGLQVSTIDTSTSATYIITYKAYDIDNLSTSIQRIVIVS